MNSVYAHELLSAARAGDRQAADQLLEANSGLIWSIVRRFYGRGVEGEDLFQLGCVGFLKAVQTFDEDYGTRFSTYAVPKISGEIRRFLRDDGPVKLSRSIKERSLVIRSAREALTQRLGREPKLSELSEEALVRIITEPKNSLVKQYQTLFAMDDVDLIVEEDAVHAIAEKALSLNTGARGLRGIFEKMMTDIMYELPSRPEVEKCIITAGVVRGEAEPVLIVKGEAADKEQLQMEKEA